jgi:DNA sulfur modification protein DndE
MIGFALIIYFTYNQGWPDSILNELIKPQNGSNTTIDVGNYGTDYLMRAAIAKYGLFANSPEEAVYPVAFTDSQGQNLTGANKYVIHFDKGQTPPVNAFWSLTMYNNASYLADNPINRYAIGDRTPGLVYNEDGSLDIYIQHESPGKDRESNWLPAPEDEFNLTLRLYAPQDQILKGEYQYPPVQRVA